MIVVRDCFVCKPGNASKLAAKLKEAAAAAGQPVESTIIERIEQNRPDPTVLTEEFWTAYPLAH